MPSEIKLPLFYEQITELLPHRYPFLMVDRVIEFTPGSGIVGYKNISNNEPFFQGHFPNRPIMPGVLMTEALAQLGGIYARLMFPERTKDKLFVFTEMENVRFRRQIIPGDRLMLHLEKCVTKLGHWKMSALARVNGETAVEAQIRAAEVSR